MLILRVANTDKLQITTSSGADCDVHASWVDVPSVGGVGVPGATNTAITTATTTDVVATPGASTQRIIKHLNVRNKDVISQDVTVIIDQNGTDFELHKATLLAGETLEYQEGIGWFVVQLTRKEVYIRRVTADSVHATAATFADITGLTCPVASGKHYSMEAHLYHIGNATTTGAQFAIGGVAMTAMRLQAIDVILGSLTAATMGSNTTDVTAIDTAAMAETTGAATVVLCILSGWFNPSASGTFAVRATSEVSVAAGLTVKQGSWVKVMETDN